MSQLIDQQFIDRFQDAFREGDENAAAKAEEAENVRVVEQVFRAVAAKTSTRSATCWPTT